MKKRTTILAGIAAALLMTLSAANARPYFAAASTYKKMNLERGEKNYAACLRSVNDGVIESGRAMAAYMKICVPDRSFETLKKEIARLVTEGATDRIRFKAYLALQVFAEPTLFQAQANTEYKDGDDFFAAIAAGLQSAYLTTATKQE